MIPKRCPHGRRPHFQQPQRLLRSQLPLVHHIFSFSRAKPHLPSVLYMHTTCQHKCMHNASSLCFVAMNHTQAQNIAVPSTSQLYNGGPQTQQTQFMACEHAPATAAPLPSDKLPDIINEKIRLDKYVDFFDIFFPDNDDYHTRIEIENLHVQSLVKKKKIPLTYPEWQSAFFKFTGVYIGFYPQLAQQLNAYGEFINWLQLHQHNWAMYDSNFRKDREKTRTPWTYRRADLQTDAALHSRRLSNYPAGNYEKFRQSSSNTTQSPWKLGYCISYYKKGSFCPN